MAKLPAEKLDALEARYSSLEEEMAKGPDADEYVKLAKEYSNLQPVVEAVRTLKKIEKDLEGAKELTQSEDKEMREMAEAEIAQLSEQKEKLVHKIRLLLLPKDAADDNNVIVEVRAGTGGDEAALFAGVLARMYQRYAEINGWKTTIMSQNEGDVGGYKEITLNISGSGAYAKLKYESGVHRVQRVPETETQGRIHTSAATVAVLPEVEDIDIEIKNEDIRIDTMRASGAGGQHVNTTDSAVRITHIPTGIVVMASEKSQHQNRASAMKVLRARLYEAEREKRDSERAQERKEQVGSGDRSGRIRTYNYPQGRVTDHRINLTLYKLDKIVEGEGLDEIIEALITHNQAAQLAALDEEQ